MSFVLQNGSNTVYKNSMMRLEQREFFHSLADGDQFLKLFDLIPEVSFFVKDRGGVFQTLSLHKHEHCGVKSEADAVGKTDHDFFSKPRADAYRDDDLMVMATGKPLVNRIEASPEIFKSPRLVATSKIPLRDKRGKIVGIAGFSRPLSEVGGEGDFNCRFEKVVEEIHRNFAHSISSKKLAEIAGFSVSQFERRFAKSFGTSPRQYILRVRIEAATHSLASSSLTISEIALACGFHDHAHLSRTFRKIMHLSPTQYRSANKLSRDY